VSARSETRKASPKSYEQYCPVARALDVLGERWTLLVVRDLLMGPKRYTDLREGLPGIATDLLTARLRTLESTGFVARRKLPRPAPATVYELTESGRRLGPAVLALGQVGLALLGAPEPDEDVRAERLVLSLRLSFRADVQPDLTEAYVLRIDGEPFTVAIADGVVSTSPGTAPGAAMSLTTDARTLVALLRGDLTAAAALTRGSAELEGDRHALERFVDMFAYPAGDPELAPSPGAGR
jgi:DNA-binding HxlR family transcriptional regulator